MYFKIVDNYRYLLNNFNKEVSNKKQISAKKYFLLTNSIDYLLDAGVWSRLSPSSPFTEQRLLGDITER